VFSQSGLSLDQAPPISVVFRFFFLGACFGIIAGISLFFYQTDIFHTSSTAALIFTHLLTLGIMLSFMFAALFQMLPVIAGVALKSPIKKANLLLYPFAQGIITLLVAFATAQPWLYFLVSLLLGFAILSSILPMLINLRKLDNHTSASKGMLFALGALFLLVLFALYLLLSLSGTLEGSYYTEVKTAHYSFGLFGWIALLIISISFQVIEMFYVTPAYPKHMSYYLPMTLFTLLLSSSLIGFFLPSIWTVSQLLIIGLLVYYALLTLKRLTERKRPLTDATVWFWRMGLSSLLLSLFFVALQYFTELSLLKPLSYIFFASFAFSIVFAMFYKIVPFLTWFHLNSQGYFTAPMMHEVIHPKTAKKHLYIHIATIVTFVLSLFIDSFIFLAGLLMILSFSWVAYQIIHAWKLYRHTQQTGKKFEMG
jgi:hypothetical protein